MKNRAVKYQVRCLKSLVEIFYTNTDHNVQKKVYWTALHISWKGNSSIYYSGRTANTVEVNF